MIRCCLFRCKWEGRLDITQQSIMLWWWLQQPSLLYHANFHWNADDCITATIQKGNMRHNNQTLSNLRQNRTKWWTYFFSPGRTLCSVHHSCMLILHFASNLKRISPPKLKTKNTYYNQNPFSSQVLNILLMDIDGIFLM